MFPRKRLPAAAEVKMDSNRFCINGKEQRGSCFSRSDLKFLVIVFSLQILVNFIVIIFFWGEEPKQSTKNFKSISPAVLDRYAADRISCELSTGTLILPYRFMSPENPAPCQKYPLIVFLHGAGSRGNDNQQQLGTLPGQLAEPLWRTKYASYVLAPQCPSRLWWGMQSVTDLIIEIIQEKIRSNPQIDPDRVYLTGLSMGGHGCWSLAARHPELFAGVAPFCGHGNPDDAPAMAGIPFWVVHGDADGVVSVSSSRHMVEALKKVHATVVYHELQGVGHNCWKESYQEPSPMMDWMFQQNRLRQR